jgi:hypothetical protein
MQPFFALDSSRCVPRWRPADLEGDVQSGARRDVHTRLGAPVASRGAALQPLFATRGGSVVAGNVAETRRKLADEFEQFKT